MAQIRALVLFKQYDLPFSFVIFTVLGFAVSLPLPLTEDDGVLSHTGCIYLRTQLSGYSNS